MQPASLSRRLLTCFALALVVLFPAWSSAAAPPLLVAGEKAAAAKLVSVARDWQMTFAVERPPAETPRTPGKPTVEAAPQTDPRTLPAGDLVAWGDLSETLPRRAQLLVLTDGSRVPGEISGADGDFVTLDTLLFGEVKVPRRRVELLLTRPPSDASARQALIRELLASTIEEDQLVLENGDRLSGRWLGAAEEKDDDGDLRQVLRVQSAAGPLSIETPRVRAVRLVPPKSTLPGEAPLRALVGFRDGTLLSVARLEWTAKGLTVEPYDPPAKPQAWQGLDGKIAGAITFVQPLGGRSRYLSDRAADSYKHAPFLGREQPYQRDRSVEGTPLLCKQRVYCKGIGLRSAGILVYSIDADAKRFEAEIGVDDLALALGAGGEMASGLGSVEFRVLVDGEERARATLRGGQAPQHLSIDVAGGKKLTLFAGFADRGDVLDFADWLNARFVK